MHIEIILDTETTGLDPEKGDRLVEIGCVELANSVPTGRTFHVYLDPERDVPEDAVRIHGLTRDFLKGKPKFSEVAADLVAFLGQATIVIHNAEFDMKFINSELRRCELPPIAMDRVIDTLPMARRKHLGASNTLDALCARYKVDNSKRTKHGALLDAELLADVYVELCGGRQKALVLDAAVKQSAAIVVQGQESYITARPQPLGPLINWEEAAAHASAAASLGEKSLWLKYEPVAP